MKRAALVVAALIAFSGQSPAPAQPAAGSPMKSGLPAVTHLVYQFGYNTPAASSGQGTGTTTIDITGMATDGGMTFTATDDWWNTVRPRQTYTCEVYPNGGVTCPNAPFAISPIQIAIAPLLGRKVFTALASDPKATWKQSYHVSATFAPSANQGFAGQVHDWDGQYTFTGKGTVPNGSSSGPLDSIHMDGALAQKTGRQIKANQKANILYDPHMKMPVYVDMLITFVPRMTVNQYTIQMKLIKRS